MSLPRITGVSGVPASLPAPASHAQAHRPAPGADGAFRPPTPGETLSLVLGSEAGSVFATGREGQAVRLTPGAFSSEALAPDLTPGDVLLVRVLATTPRLELAPLGPPIRALGAEATPALLANLAAMQADQAALLRMAWAPPDALALATSWRVGVLAHLRQIAEGRDAGLAGGWAPHPAGAWAAGLLDPADAAALAQPPAGPPSHSAASSATSPIERWLFPIYGWSGLPLSLHLLPPYLRQPPATIRRRARTWGWGLRVEGSLPHLGRIELQAQMLGDGVALVITTEHEAALERLRTALGVISGAVGRTGLRLIGCRLQHEPLAPGLAPGHTSAPPPPNQPAPFDGSPQGAAAWLDQALSSSTALPPGLFRVVAEVLVGLGGLG